jgi:hypothetical protein
MNTEAFLRNLFQHSTGYVGVFDSRFRSTSYFDLQSLSAASEHALSVSEGGGDAYMNVCTRTTRLPTEQRGGEADVPNVQTLWADIDYGTLGHKSDKCPPTVQDAYSLFSDLPKPSIVVNSGGGLHCYWLLASPIATAHGKELNKALQTHIANTAQQRGWHCDAKCFNPAWMLRVPGTKNHKAKPARDVTIVSAPLARYKPEAFGAVQYTTPSAKPKPEHAPLAAALEPRATKTPTEARLAMREWLKTSKKEWAKPLLRGESFAEPGERDTTINTVCATLAFVDPDTDAEALVEVMRASLEAMAEDAPCDKDPVDNAIEKLTRHQVTARQDRANQEQWDREMRERQAQRARAAAEQRLTETPTSAEPTSGVYTDAEILEYAQSQHCSVEEFRRRWIIQKADTFYVFVSGRYMPPIMRTELEVSLPRDLAPATIEWSVPTNNGSRPKKVAEILRDHCTVARSVQANMTVDNSYYDEKTQTFVEAACRKRPIVPREDPVVHEWLTLLGGDNSEPLLDWVATFTDLSRQTCAVYLVGRPGDGKTMFAEGLARIYTIGAPTELESVLSNFNEALLDCPLIFGDEKIPSMIGDSGDLRQIIGKNSRKLKRKHKAEADLVGAVRLILAANNDTLLTFEENLSAWDQQAVAQRFLYVTPSPRCKDFLISLGGRSGTDDWVTGDRIAAHALWLRDNRKVQPGERFLVQASSAALSRMLATQGKWPGLVCEWLCRHLTTPQMMMAGAAVRVGDGEYLVNSTAISEYWQNYIKSNNVPTSALLGRTLKTMSIGQKQIGSSRYHSIDIDTLMDWAGRNHVGDVDEMRAKIAAPFVEKSTGKVLEMKR